MKNRGKRGNDETLGAVTHIYNLLGDDKNMKSTHIDENNNKKDIRTHKYVPLIVLLLICIIGSILIVAIILNNEFKEINNLSKITSTKMLAETVGQGINATFNSSTGEVKITGTGTINKENLRSYWETCGRDNITSITFENEGIYVPEDSTYLFGGLTKLVTINNANYLNTSNVTNMAEMFKDCKELTSIDVNEWNVENVTNMGGIFLNCTSLTSINLSNWDTRNAIEYKHLIGGTESMFAGCTSLTEIYTPREYSSVITELPTKSWYNIDNTSDNTVYASFNNETFTGSVHLGKLTDYNITYELNEGIENENTNPSTYNYLSSFTLTTQVK